MYLIKFCCDLDKKRIFFFVKKMRFFTHFLELEKSETVTRNLDILHKNYTFDPQSSFLKMFDFLPLFGQKKEENFLQKR